jgi:type III pantothenate kinase
MNLIAIDIGNTNIKIGLFLQSQIETVQTIPAENEKAISETLNELWQKIITVTKPSDNIPDVDIVASSVKPDTTEKIKQLVMENLDQKLLIIPDDIPLPINLSVGNPEKTGTDRVLSACAGYAVVEKAVVVADFGTAVTIDIVDDRGVFLGGTIIPGFEISANALHEQTAQLPAVKVHKPKLPWGKNTEQAINAGLYYSAIGALQEIIRRYAEKIGTWPRTVITGSNAKIIKQDCQFIDSYVPNLVVKGIALAYRKYINQQKTYENEEE